MDQPILHIYAGEGGSCLMRVGQLTESEGSDALMMPFYKSKHPRRSNDQGSQFDLGNSGLITGNWISPLPSRSNQTL